MNLLMKQNTFTSAFWLKSENADAASDSQNSDDIIGSEKTVWLNFLDARATVTSSSWDESLIVARYSMS